MYAENHFGAFNIAVHPFLKILTCSAYDSLVGCYPHWGKALSLFKDEAERASGEDHWEVIVNKPIALKWQCSEREWSHNCCGAFALLTVFTLLHLPPDTVLPLNPNPPSSQVVDGIFQQISIQVQQETSTL